MLPYIISTLLSILFASFAFKAKERFNYLILSAIAISIPCFLAGVRDSGVGVDMLSYGDPVFFSTARAPFSVIFNAKDTEPLFNLVAFLCSNLTGNIHFYYFIIEMLVLLPLYNFISSNCPQRYKTYAWALVFVLLFGYSLNLMRQMIAVSFLLWGYKFLVSRKYYWYAVVCLVSAGFHLSTGACGLVIIAAYELFNNESNEFLKNGTWICACLLVIFFVNELINLGVLVKDSYVYQLSHNEGMEFGLFVEGLIKRLGLFSPVIILLILNFQNCKKRIDHFNFLLIMFITSLLLYQLGVASSQMFRLSLPFYAFTIFFIPCLLESLKNRNDRIVYGFAIMIVLSAYAFYFFQNNGDISPYTSVLLGIQ